MKKVLGSLLAATALLSLAACGGSSDDASSQIFRSKIVMSLMRKHQHGNLIPKKNQLKSLGTSTQTGRHYLLGKMLPPHRSRKI